MRRLEEVELTGLLDRLGYRPPALEAVFQPNRSPRWAGSRWSFLVPAAVIVVLMAASGVVAAANGWFEQFVPGGDCASLEPACGADFAQVGLLVDQTTGVTAVNILIKPGLADARVAEIAEDVAAEHRTQRTIVYVLEDLPTGPMSAGFASLPADDNAAPPLPPAELVPYLRLTYDLGPTGDQLIWP